jgi:hypothetical protein
MQEIFSLKFEAAIKVRVIGDGLLVLAHVWLCKVRPVVAKLQSKYQWDFNLLPIIDKDQEHKKEPQIWNMLVEVSVE